MCGICGFTGKSDTILLRSMMGSLLHRGPDEEGLFVNDKINLGFRRLSIVDIKSGQQPVHNEDKSLWSIFNGEIYNHKELRSELLKKGHQFYTDHSDSELIVHLYEEYGESFVKKINGMFAIALWNNNEERLLLFRDRMGVKPIFYSSINGKLVFSSEIKAILLHPDYSKEVNTEAIFHYFSFKNIPSPLTAFQGIFCLLPGEVLDYSRGNISKRKWWKVTFKENEGLNEAQTKDTIISLLEDSVRIRTECDVSFGAYLSGGLDSSLIVSIMAQISDQPIKTFSLGYTDNLKNKETDLYFARKVSRQFQTDHHEYIISSKELVDDIESVIAAFDQPFAGTISTFFLSKLIAKHVKVALSGDGADELFGSYLSHRLAQPMHHLKQLQKKKKGLFLSNEELQLLEPFDLEYLNNLDAGSLKHGTNWRYSLYVFSDEDKERLFSSKFKSILGGQVSTRLLLENYLKSIGTSDPLNRILELEWNTHFPDQVLAFVDSLSMAHSLETRSPFLDYRLVEFAATIPGNMKIKNGIVKDILKQAAKSRLHTSIIQRQKEGFVLPIFVWMLDQLKLYILEILSEKRLKRHGLLSVGYVNHIVKSFYEGDRDLAAKIWTLAMFQVWWETYFGN